MKQPYEVLLVEDNAGDALLIGQALADSPKQVHLHVARDGEQALQLLQGFEPDLIILDLNIPKVSGFTVLTRHVGRAPVVVFSASENESDAERALGLGAVAYVHKPMDLEDYKTSVNQMIDKWTDCK